MELENLIEDIINNSKGDIAVAIKNLESNSTIMINEKEVFPSASTIKLLIMVTAMQEVKEGKRNLKDKIIISTEEKCGGDGILKELNKDHNFTLIEIITLMIIISDNTATNILIDMLGMDNINKIANELKLNNTRLQRKMMDSEAVKMGKENLTTALDMCTILEMLYKGEIVDKEYSNIMIEILKKQQVNGRLTLYLPDDLVVAHKTGDLDKLEHDVGIVYYPYCNYIICVLTKNLYTNKEGREIIGKISYEVYKSFKKFHRNNVSNIIN
ncbi:beta-lactamase class A [Clostridium tetanomorphum]|uniref:Serine hydrolase n=1 Tax=Clostridium tetanomorphum TaxID=1553 RepID=A0A923EE08_CLOTT|nr:serine hydrolase [Clostridium tetanomorphum]KAJ50618.1 beta-lactamase [Clostridium tetanomorphum DSM 665]MBC2399078.1 serine hydrolase [Clostridium tetanomorphum]MBP1862693.1 beta-lactamase class A [Clostridium tetanomorphum]NRS85467.1 beta-lactamase class A [Clostridium tetanomorphum]NRZ98581.1 beta-lactamase class A [Clostridium tetanomorphum]